MLPKDAFLRRLPKVVDSTQAVQLDALLFSADAIQASMAAIRRVAAVYLDRIVGAPHEAQVELFTRAWSIVDCIHVVRQVLAALDYETPQASAFIEKYENARRLRNGMDHLSQNAANLAKRKGSPPVFGSLAYVCVPPKNIAMTDGEPTLTGAGLVLLAIGRATDGGQMPAINPLGRPLRVPVGGFQLAAFDEVLELEQAEDDLKELVVEVNDRLEKDLTARIEAAAEQHGLPVEKLMGADARGVSVYVAMKFEPTSIREKPAPTAPTTPPQGSGNSD